MRSRWMMSVGAAVMLAACGAQDEVTSTPDELEVTVPDTPEARTVTIPGDDRFTDHLQRALITAQEGDTIALPAGKFSLSDGLSLDVDRVTLKGAGEDETVLSFKDQTGAGEGLLVTSDDVILTGFTMQDTAGDGIKSKGADRIIFRDMTVEWTGGPLATNGAYGFYPVESTDILIEGVTVRGASDAGIYVGQSNNIIVRNSVAEYNVAGIEIENSIGADVYGNRTEYNTGGILIFDLPDLPQVGGNSTRVYDNIVVNNNTPNFAPPGNIVAGVPTGTGVMIMANENIHIFDNQLINNDSAHVLVVAYPNVVTDEDYNPLPRNVVVRDNTYSQGGQAPGGVLADFAAAVGGTLPPVVWDGVTGWGDNADQTINLTLNEPETIGFVSLGLGSYPIDPAAISPSTDRPEGTPKAEPAAIVLEHKTGL